MQTDESSEEKQLREETALGAFQKELDTAIEEHRLSDIADLKLFRFDESEHVFEIDVFGVKYKHKLKMPEIVDEIRKEAMAPTIRSNAGRFEGDDLVQSDREPSNALRRFYDSLAVEVWGYPIDDDDNGETWYPVTKIVEDAEVLETGSDKTPTPARTLIEFIPDSDKIKVASMVYASQNYVISEKGRRMKSIKAKREYIVKQMFGIERDENGDLKKPSQVVAHHFDEASAKDLADFSKCETSKTRIRQQGQQPESRSTLNVEAAAGLYDRLINCVQGGSIDGKEVLQISKGDSRLEKIAPRLKTDAVFIYMNFLKR